MPSCISNSSPLASVMVFALSHSPDENTPSMVAALPWGLRILGAATGISRVDGEGKRVAVGRGVSGEGTCVSVGEASPHPAINNRRTML